MNIKVNLQKDKKKTTRNLQEDSDKEIKEELDHELNFSFEYSIEEMGGPNVCDIGFFQKTPSVHNFVLFKLNTIKWNRPAVHYIEGLKLISID